MAVLLLQEIMAWFMKKMYSVPYCFPSSNVSRDNYYSMADYDARNGKKLEHYCLSGDGKPNYWHYVAEDFCRGMGCLFSFFVSCGHFPVFCQIVLHLLEHAILIGLCREIKYSWQYLIKFLMLVFEN